ncbi:MAG: DNA mismatch repair protein MutS [Alphaproteobacteria bacterium]|nr:DNA mismatch repair protein MutS [Alphaproteobacteria bacterium]
MTQKEEKVNPSTQQYLDIKEKYKDYLVFYRMGDFYELFFEDAGIAAKALDLVLTKRGTYKGKPIPMCGVPFHAYENYLARLIHQGFKVAIAEQVETPEEAKKRGRSALVERQVIRVVTAGTLTEDNLLEARENNYLLSVVSENDSLGFAWLDLSTGDFVVKETITDVNCCGKDIYACLSKINPSEIIVSDRLFENEDIFRVLSLYQDRMTVLPQARFNVENAKKRIEKFFGVISADAFVVLSRTETAAVGIILDYVENTQISEKPRLKPIVRQSDTTIMEIDAATRHNLELVSSFSGNKKSSLLAAIDYTVTGAGARLFTNRLLNPSTDVEEINQRLDSVDFFVLIQELRRDMRAILKQTADMERIVSRLAVNRGSPKDMSALKNSLMMVPKIKNLINNFGKYDTLVSKIPDAIKQILQKMPDFSALVDEIERALKADDDLPSFARDGGFVKSGYSALLDELQNLKTNQVDIMARLEKEYADILGVPKVVIRYNNMVGYFMEISNKFADAAVQNPKFIHRQTILNAMRFTTEELSDLEQKILTAEDKALAVEQEIFKDLTLKILARSDDISKMAYAYAELDCATSVAELAVLKNYTRPTVDDSLCFDIKDGRHPAVEKALEKSHEGPFVSNDCTLDGQKDRIWLITGPNMAGKSTFLRQNAIIAIMAQMGCFVPASKAHIGIVDKVFSRVGASDDLSQGRSTFMTEMVETSAILNGASSKSFVILDEIGRGTATYDGLSIAWSVVEYLHEINKCRALFATHYHELTVLKEKLKQLSLHAMKIKEYNGDVVFMHEVIDGAADRSYGIHVAKLAGLPVLAVKRAEQILKALEKNPNNKKVMTIDDDLPLFAALQKTLKEDKPVSPLHEMLDKLNPDNMTPREALDKLYEIQSLYRDIKKKNI